MCTKNFQMYKLGLEKAEEPQIKLQHLLETEKARGFQKSIYFCFIDYSKAFVCRITTNCGKFFKRRVYQTT